MRTHCATEMVKMDAPGYAIGGLSGGEKKTDFVRVVAHTAALLPEDKPRYLMGVGFPVDLLICASLGVDMFDCVYPTRTARFGTAFSRGGDIKLKKPRYSTDLGPIDDKCTCETCLHYSRAYLNAIMGRQAVAA